MCIKVTGPFPCRDKKVIATINAGKIISALNKHRKDEGMHPLSKESVVLMQRAVYMYEISSQKDMINSEDAEWIQILMCSWMASKKKRTLKSAISHVEKEEGVKLSPYVWTIVNSCIRKATRE